MTTIVPANPNGNLPAAAITPIEYAGLQVAYNHFNVQLFNGRLPDVMITYQRRGNSRGFYGHERFAGRLEPGLRHELALNPDHFIGRSDREICSTLGHEQVHVWQFAYGKPSRRGYHNKEWAAKMIEIGLMPSSTGAAGGNKTGQRMTHFIIDGGLFDRAFGLLAISGWKLNLQSAPEGRDRKPPDPRVKFRCPDCGTSLRSGYDALPLCAPCGRFFLPPHRTEAEMIEATAQAQEERKARAESGAAEFVSANPIQWS
jgi:hypothetical protein